MTRHMIAVAVDQGVWVWGEGKNGHLGVEAREKVDGRKVLPLKLHQRMKVVDVAAGQTTSFLLLES